MFFVTFQTKYKRRFGNIYCSLQSVVFLYLLAVWRSSNLVDLTSLNYIPLTFQSGIHVHVQSITCLKFSLSIVLSLMVNSVTAVKIYSLFHTRSG